MEEEDFLSSLIDLNLMYYSNLKVLRVSFNLQDEAYLEEDTSLDNYSLYSSYKEVDFETYLPFHKAF